ncbi:MAG: signal peptidase I [Bacillota bacterium]
MQSEARGIIRDIIEIVVIAFVIAVVIRTFVVQVTRVPSESMVPTIQVGDRLLTDRILYRIQGIRHGDIVVFQPPFATTDPYVKRVIGLPGDRIAIHDGKVYRNGEPLDEPYLAEPPDYSRPELTVPPGAMYVMGDNRNHSNDSHEWGFAQLSSISGRAFWRLWPLNRFGPLPR